MKAVYVSLEGHPGELVRALMRFGADPASVFLVTRLPDGLDDLASIVADLRPGLVVVDTLTSLVEALDLVDEHTNDAGGWTDATNRLGAIAREADAGLLLIHHARKSDGKYRDSSAIGAGADMILEMVEAEQDATLRSFRPRGRWSVDRFSIRLDGDAFRLDAGEVSVDARVLDAVRQNPGTSLAQIRRSVGGRGAEVDTAVERLLSRGMLVDQGSGARHVYHVTPGQGRDEVGTRSTAPTLSGLSDAGQGADKVGTRSGQGHLVPTPNPIVATTDARPTGPPPSEKPGRP